MFYLLERHTPGTSSECFFMKIWIIFQFSVVFWKSCAFSATWQFSYDPYLQKLPILLLKSSRSLIQENNHLCTFVAMKIDPRVFRPHRLFLRISTGPKNLQKQTYNYEVIWKKFCVPQVKPSHLLECSLWCFRSNFSNKWNISKLPDSWKCTWFLKRHRKLKNDPNFMKKHSEDASGVWRSKK